MNNLEIILSHFLKDEESREIVRGILTGSSIHTFTHIGKVRIVFTDEERAEYLCAILEAQQSFWPWNRDIASHLSCELEELICGYKPERYIKVP
jgi:hypothetical protein